MLTSPGTRALRLLVVAAWLPAGACGGGAHDEQVEWVLAEEPEDGTYELRAEFGGSSCTDFQRWEVEESSAEVEVRAIVRFSGAADCTADLVLEPYTLRLTRPLGSRALVGCAPDDEERECTEVAPPPGSV